MRLRKLLNESREEYAAQRLNDLFDSGKFLDSNKTLLYRADSPELRGFYEVRDIRKDRKALDTHPAIHEFVVFVGEYFYPELPNRKESKFAATEEKTKYIKRNYGTPYICFPEMSAKVATIEKDAYSYFGPLDRHLGDINILVSEEGNLLSDLKIINQDCKDLILGIVGLYRRSRVNEHLEKISYSGSYKEVIQSVNQARETLKNEYPNEHYYDTFGKFTKFLRVIYNYFNDMELGIYSPSKEIIFDGSEYLLVKPDFFKQYFTFKHGMWVLKDQYR